MIKEHKKFQQSGNRELNTNIFKALKNICRGQSSAIALLSDLQICSYSCLQGQDPAGLVILTPASLCHMPRTTLPTGFSSRKSGVLSLKYLRLRPCFSVCFTPPLTFLFTVRTLWLFISPVVRIPVTACPT